MPHVVVVRIKEPNSCYYFIPTLPARQNGTDNWPNGWAEPVITKAASLWG